MTADLIRAKALLKDDVTCALVGGGRAVTSTQRGVKPLLAWLGGDHRGFAAADKVVGRAAAFLYVLLGVSSLYAAVLSEPALAVLRAHHIPVEYDTLAARIVSAMPGATLLMTASVASGVTSLLENPVPPVVTARHTSSS